MKSFEKGVSRKGTNMATLKLEVTDGSKINQVKDWLYLTNKAKCKINSL